ncbi:acyl carrier protein [Nocardiopsis sp. NPDC049922]|uniref:acyl carrier protein n=1 Tax=Nocardiopsis sp. NPDC049922 TaxID=3155157 RepID=UPI0033CAF8DB
MTRFTPDVFRRVTRESVGVDDTVDLDGDILDTPFPELGYDSLAVMEIANKVEKEFGLSLPEEDLGDLETPRAFIDYVNSRVEVVGS